MSFEELNNHAKDLFRSKEYKESIEFFTRALEIQPNSAVTCSNLAQALLNN